MGQLVSGWQRLLLDGLNRRRLLSGKSHVERVM